MIFRSLRFVGSWVAGIALGIALLLVELSWTPAYDHSDPNYHRYAEAFDRLRVQLDRRGATNKDFIDLSQLNNGDWKTACLFGGYMYPLGDMQALGAKISAKDRWRLSQAGWRGFRAGQVEEEEMAIAYVDLNNSAQFIHFASGIGPEGQHFKKCISKPQTRLVLGQVPP
jgi:hypothetical protein